ncbi:MAG: OmpA family protein, partial [bacterium]|nr:OmpA family protein [bacterium]
MRQYPDEKVTIEGHTDSRASDEHNMWLSQKRVESVKMYLVEEEGIPKERMAAIGYGERNPIASNTARKGMQLNRRVEIKSTGKEVIPAPTLIPARHIQEVKINEVLADVGTDGQYQRVFDTRIDTLTITMIADNGKSVKVKESVPVVEMISPLEEQVLLEQEITGITLMPTLITTLKGRTDPDCRVFIDEKETMADKGGLFTRKVELQQGENIYKTTVVNPQGYSAAIVSRILVSVEEEKGTISITATKADLEHSMEQADDTRQIGIAAESPLILKTGKEEDTATPIRQYVTRIIPNLEVRLPKEGLIYRANSIWLCGQTDKGNKVMVNGKECQVLDNGKLQHELAMKDGENEIVVTVQDEAGNVGSLSHKLMVDTDYLFLVAVADGEIGKMSAKGRIEPVKHNDRYQDGFYKDGRLAYYLKGKVRGRYLITSGFDSEKSDKKRLFSNLDPDRYYPLYGDSGQVVHDAQTQGKLYLLIEADEYNVLIGNYHTGFNDTDLASYNRTFYGGMVSYQSVVRTENGLPVTRLTLFGASVKQLSAHNEFSGRGGSLYYLKHADIIEGSEQVRIEIRDRDTNRIIKRLPQQRNADYTIKYHEGRILFNRPVPSIIQSELLIDDKILDGDNVYVVVDYEYEPNALDKGVVGLRFNQQINANLRLGATCIEEDKGVNDYQLQGVDAVLKIGRHVAIYGECASSRFDSDDNHISRDGGLSFNTIASSSNKDGDAWQIKLNTSLDNVTLSGYCQRLNPGFSSRGIIQEEGIKKYGADAKIQIAKHNSLLLKHDIQELLNNGMTTSWQKEKRSTVQLKHQMNKLNITEEYSRTEREQKKGDVVTESLACKMRFNPTDRISTYIEHQLTLRGETNYQTTLGLDAKLSDNITGRVQKTIGKQGCSSMIGLDADTGNNSKLYINHHEHAAGDNLTTIGGEARISENSKTYGQYELRGGISGKSNRALLGLNNQWDIAQGLKLNMNYEFSQTKNEKQADTTRLASSVAAEYTMSERINPSSRREAFKQPISRCFS